MFICQITGEYSKQGEKLNKIVVERRDRSYSQHRKNEETNEWELVEVGRGWEIVREVNASDEGVRTWDSWSDSERQVFLKHSR
jgi:hypothetical protein